MTSWFSSSSALDEVHGDLSPFQWFVASPAWLQAGAAWLYSLLLFGQGLLLKLCYPCTFWLHKRPRQWSALAKWSQLLLWLLFQLHSILQNILHMIRNLASVLGQSLHISSVQTDYQKSKKCTLDSKLCYWNMKILPNLNFPSLLRGEKIHWNFNF